MERLPSLLSRLRIAAGLSSRDAAAKLGVGESTVASWETSAAYLRIPGAAMLERVLDQYGASDADRDAARRSRHAEECARGDGRPAPSGEPEAAA